MIDHCLEEQVVHASRITPHQLDEHVTARDVQLIDIRNAGETEDGMIPGAVNIPHAAIDAASAAAVIADGTIAVTYCAGPHCNASTLAARRLAQLGYPVKEMLGGYDYWVRDGYPVASGPA